MEFLLVRSALSILLPLSEWLALAEDGGQVAIILLLSVAGDDMELVALAVVALWRGGGLLVVVLEAHGHLYLVHKGVVRLHHVVIDGVLAEELVDLGRVDVLLEAEVELSHGLAHRPTEGLERVATVDDVFTLHGFTRDLISVRI